MNVVVAIPEAETVPAETSPAEIIGFDFGHAETALTKAITNASTQPTVVEIRGEAPFITAVAEHPERGVLIGENAYKARDPETVRVAFKSPDFKNAETRRLTKLFVRKVVDTLTDDRLIEGPDRTLFVVGCPSGWDTAIRENFESLLRQCGMVHVDVLAESHAAFLAARDSLEVPADSLERSVLIVDIGSSTTDFTAVVGLEQQRMDFGSNELGAGILDKIILRRWLDDQNDRDLSKLIDQSPQHNSVCLLHCRKVKEEYFNSDNTDEAPAVITKRLIIGGQRYLFDVEITDQDMDTILSSPIGDGLERSSELERLNWRDAFRKKLQDARKAMRDVPPQMILLTGGASRMDFVVTSCEEVFPDASVRRGSEPQFTIARGLAWAGRQLTKTAMFQTDIERILESGSIQEGVRGHLQDLKPRIAEVAAHIFTEEVIIPTFNEWRSGRISTLNEMSSVMKSRGQQVFGNLSEVGATKEFGEVVELWVDESVRPTVERLVEPACERAGIAVSHLAIGDDLQLPSIEVPSGDVELTDMKHVGKAIVTIGASITAAILGGGGTALLMSGPIGWIIGFVAAAAILRYGQKVSMDKIREVKMPVLMRKMAIRESKLREQMEEKRGDFRDEIGNGLEDESFDELLQEVARAVNEELSKRADSAVMLIR